MAEVIEKVEECGVKIEKCKTKVYELED